jgi:tRNA modification GTPase
MSELSGRSTIFALSSGKVPSGVAVIRISGPDTSAALVRLTDAIPLPRHATLKNITAADGRVLDTALVLWFPGPASFTGEDCAEIQCHGGPAVIAALLKELSTIDGCRLADAGEFSLRAFTNGKADLTQMEALADLIYAETESQRALAIAEAGGTQRMLYESWRSDLLKARAYLEADLDFSDEEDVPGSVADAANTVVAHLISCLEAHLKTAGAAEMIRDGFRVVIAGAPNAGKSTLLNTLAKRDVAIVTEIAGTTRDVLDVSLDIGGFKVVVSDTAGLRQTSDRIEKMGIERAYLAIESANLVLMLSDTVPASFVSKAMAWNIRTKSDIGSDADKAFDFSISCRTGHGIEDLIAAIGHFVRQSLGIYREGEIVTRARHVALLQNAREALLRFSTAKLNGTEFAAEELRVAADALGCITGTISSDDVLGAIFSSFCIGK